MLLKNITIIVVDIVLLLILFKHENQLIKKKKNEPWPLLHRIHNFMYGQIFACKT